MDLITLRQRWKQLLNRDAIPALLKEAGFIGPGAEVGVNLGVFSEKLLRGSDLSRLYSIDSWAPDEGYVDQLMASRTWEDRYKEAKRRLNQLGERSTIMRMTSVEAADRFGIEDLDFVYLDADHRFNPCLQDLKLWWPKVRQGGILSGHDFRDGPNDCEVRRAVLAFSRTRGMDVILIQGSNPSWMIPKGAS